MTSFDLSTGTFRVLRIFSNKLWNMNFMTVVARFPATLIAAFFLKQWLCKLGSY